VNTAEQTFAFADLAGFTALTEAHGDEQAADLAAEFSRSAADLLSRHGAVQIKTIGDALMLRVDEPAEAITLGLALTGELMAEHGYPAIRVGMHTGPAVERSGDWFGAAVNLAARISGLAAGSEVLLSQATMAQAGEVDGVRFDERGQQRLRNVSEPITIFAALSESRAPRESLIDPVCRMAIDPCRAAGTLTHEEREYHFCSLACAARFAADPETYALRDPRSC